jgi:hypothetical protein
MHEIVLTIRMFRLRVSVVTADDVSGAIYATTLRHRQLESKASKIAKIYSGKVLHHRPLLGPPPTAFAGLELAGLDNPEANVTCWGIGTKVVKLQIVDAKVVPARTVWRGPQAMVLIPKIQVSRDPEK